MEELAVNNWLCELQDAVYDADDIIDSARLEGSKLLEDHPLSSRNSTGCSGISILSCFPSMQRRHEIAIEIKNLNTRIEKISKLGKKFLTRSEAAPSLQGSMFKPRKSSQLVEPNLVGKEIIHSTRKLVDLILSYKEDKAYKLAIVGTGGVGKTTLVQKVYNDHRIKGNFEKHAWICVSRDYNDVTLLKEVLRNMGLQQGQGETIAELQSKLAEIIKGKSFFLVLDDLWQFNVWTDLLRTPLHAAAAGIILLTTRDDTIAMKIGAEHTHRVDLMPVEVGWELLWKSMNIREENELQSLRNIGIEIVRKCGCLPLAIKVTASVLASRDQTENEWKKILSKNAWNQSKLPTEIECVLYLSYAELPHHLKQCFLYCALYPEGRAIDRDDLVRLWVAEGFVEEKQGQLLEDTAEEYYYELINRNLLQPNGSYFDHSECKMHDLLRELACYLSKEECFVGDPESLRPVSIRKLRRISVTTDKDMLLPSMDKEQLKIWTFKMLSGVSLVVDHSFIKKFQNLRVFDLGGSHVRSIPSYIGSLIHLRLLDLDSTDISCLPETIGSLKNLQILNLQRCAYLHSLPLAVTQLHNLRRLGLRDTPINLVPKGIYKLKFLNDLEGLPAGGGSENSKTQNGWKLEELAHLSQLRRVYITKLERAAPCSTDAILEQKRYLKVLSLRCTQLGNAKYSEEDVRNIEKTFDQLSPPHNVEDLFIGGFFGRRYPTWLDATILSSVKHLKLVDCRSCLRLPPIGELPMLKYLRIVGASAITKIGPEFVGCKGGNLGPTKAIAFPKLEWLIIEDMPNLEEWSFVDVEEETAAAKAAEMQRCEASSLYLQLLPRLKELYLINCPKLRALPKQFGQETTSLRKLQLSRTGSLKVVENLQVLSETLVIESCESLEKVSNLPMVRELLAKDCQNLRCVEGLGSLQQLCLTKDMKETSSLWVPGLQQQRRQLHGDDLDVYTAIETKRTPN
jgi:hypothetical protein